ncbi:GNAT family N-acetyltransferase [Zoogloea sp.]|uniref:GNAT family N-acetyltransferase n=1 Tax=Zoogloea sp. TaxID=49181 RepID=UPI0035B3D516
MSSSSNSSTAEPARRAARRAGQLGPITINAARGAMAAYRRLGFEAEGPSEEVRGIRCVPMTCRHPAPAPNHAAPVA